MLLRRSLGLTLAIALAAAFGAALPAQAAGLDTTSPAGPVTGVIVIVSPAVGTGAVGAPVAPGPFLAPLSPPRGQLPPLPASLQAALNPTLPAPPLPGILIAAPTSTGSLVIPVRAPAGSAASTLTQLQIVIPGPNPAQNTPVALAQLLDQVLRSMQAGTPGTAAPGPLVSVFSAPAP